MLASPPRSSIHNGQANTNLPTSGINDHSTPLAGAIICCTSVPDEKRTSLAAQAKQMGAIHRLDLTLDVTHLIIGNHDSEKYRYVARERPDIRPMTMEWIEAMRDLWMNDQEIDLDEMERRHTLPTLHSLRLSMTGCDDAIERNSIAEQVKANGGSYEGDLTKQITHLISFRTEGPKYKAARNWGLKVVSIEWLQDTLERGMILNETLYDPVLPVSERGKGAWDRTKPKRTSLGKRQRQASTITEGGKKKLRRSASTKLNSQSSQIWGEIVSGANITQVHRSGQWETSEDTATLAGHDRTNPSRPDTSKEGRSAKIERPKTVGIFSGHYFHFYGFPPERAQILQNHLHSNGAQVYETIQDMISSPTQNLSSRLLIITPHDLLISRRQGLPPSNVPLEVVTVWWLERCLHSKKFLDPNEHVIGRPFKTFPIPGFERLTISTSAFSGIDLLHVTKAIALLGGNYSEDMTAQTSVIVAKTLNQIRKDKYDFAQEWKIPIVSAAWLWDSIEAGTKLPLQAYRQRTKKAPNSPIVRDISIESGGPCSVNQKTDIPETVSLSTSSKIPLKDVTEEEREKSVPVVVDIKEEPTCEDLNPSRDDMMSKAQCNSRKSEPLSERDINSSSKTVSTAPAPSDHPNSREDYSTAISDLLTKRKSATAQAPAKEAPGTSRRHKRILGRAPSNMSSGSASHSRAASVDSTLANGVIKEGSKDEADVANKTANERIEMLLSGNERMIKDVESQPPMTQLEYDDPESREAEERAMARMLGNKVPKRPLEKAKTLTLNDLESMGEQPRARRSKTGMK